MKYPSWDYNLNRVRDTMTGRFCKVEEPTEEEAK